MAAPMAATDKRSVSRTALVTGAARGIGLATAEALLAAGHRVAMVDKDGDAVRASAARLPSDRTRSIAGEFGRDGITANCVAPGYIDTAMAALHGADKNAEIAKQIPVGRAGTPQEVAAAIAFLASDEAGYMTGAVIDINGGIFMA